MRKLKLDTSALRVESFEACDVRRGAPGTVRPNDATVGCTEPETCGDVTNCGDTCFCADTSPRPSCEECSWQGCPTFLPDCP